MAMSLAPQRPATNMPTVPTYKMPSGNTNPALPQAQRSQFFADNPWSNEFAGFNDTASGYGTKLLDTAMASNPMGAGGVLSDPSKYLSTFNLNYPDVNNPATIAALQKWGGILGGGAQNQVNQMLPQLVSAGITGSRGGYGSTGAENPMALQGQAIKTVAGDYGNRINTAMEYLKNLAVFNQGNAGNYVNAISKIYGDTLGAGQGMMGLNLQGLTAADASKLKYLQDAYGAYSADVGDYNRWNETDAERQWAIKQRNQALSDAQGEKGKRQALDDLSKTLSFTRAGQPDPGLQGYAANEYLKGQGYYGNRSTAAGGKGGLYPAEGSPSDIKSYQAGARGLDAYRSLWGAG